MADEIDFSELTKAQTACMNYHAFRWHAGLDQSSEKTRISLHKKGLLTASTVRSKSAFGAPLAWIEYEMPIAVHIAWCAHVAQDCDGDV